MYLFLTGLLIFTTSAGYAAGRVHQWYRHALERDEAWRDGYDQASGTLFKVATRVARRRHGEHTGDIPPARAAAGSTAAGRVGRHSFDLRHEITRRLPRGDSKAI